MEPQGALFDPDELADHHVGRGEFAGMEFIHTHARTIINELPKASSMPFRHTINVYRGCSHACQYCFARPTHEFLGMGIGEDFERRIVVKVNAVELLRAELAGRRWAGHHIAMGTNTDPYQRCEGKYHLTQGVVRVLSEAANPFSLLTKSTLILRDLELLAEAARRTDVRVNLSIGTLDEDVWRLTEPGTPSPRQRVEAVRRLNQAGVPCGVLVAPVLPGLSDGPAQLAEVVDACVGAGAVSISTVLLHLRPGVREHYLAWLGEHRPDLVADYERRYRRAYLPANEQRALSDLVRRLVADASGRYQTPRRVRWVDGGRTERVRAQMMGPATARSPEARSPEARPPEVEPLNLSFEERDSLKNGVARLRRPGQPPAPGAGRPDRPSPPPPRPPPPMTQPPAGPPPRLPRRRG
jgi:DNA repair photolyase